jgi:hypothetical protein
VIRRWVQILGIIGLAAAMLGAPCRNCAPKEEAKAPCGHDCCPRPKPAKESKPCTWQPAGFDALEKSKESPAPEWQAAEAPVLRQPAMPAWMPERKAPLCDGSPPGLQAPVLSPLRI